MNYSLSMTESVHEQLMSHLFAEPRVERAAYMFGRLSRTDRETRLLITRVISVADEDVEDSSPVHMRIRQRSFLRAMKEAADARECFVFVHSHPSGMSGHSPQDDREEKTLFATAYNRIRHPLVHASIVVSDPGQLAARVWLESGEVVDAMRVRVVGNRFTFSDALESADQIPVHFDRQVRAFGSGIQQTLGRLTVGVVGAGGTGSAVIQQLIRLGVGRLLVSDGEPFDETNVNRVHGSSVRDHGTAKIEIVRRAVAQIGLGTILETYGKPITYASVLKQFRDCDVLFGCTDNEWSRSLLARFAVYYLIPVFDMGVRIASTEGRIDKIEGRVTTLVPGQACLVCRGRISAERVSAESVQTLDPERAQELRKEGYVPELEDPAPAVVAFTTSIASSAISELLHRLTGYLGAERVSSELIYRFSDERLSTNTRAPQAGCFCADPRHVGRGDVPLFMNIVWRSE